MESGNETVIDTRFCTDLNEEINSLLSDGFRLDMIKPADAPCEALLSKNGQQVRLTTDPQSQIPHPRSTGRAGMEYRDLIPGRLNGRVIASHIRIPEGGPVPDYVHYHKIKFQMIYCKAGWVRVVYEDQGPPFVLNAGDCVLQPPGIRHRVLESSAGAEVVEVSSPAEHETWVDHDLTLPTNTLDPDRLFDGQRFVRSIATDADWHSDGKVHRRDTGIGDATGGLVDVRVARVLAEEQPVDVGSDAEQFIFVLAGENEVFFAEKSEKLAEGDGILLPAEQKVTLKAFVESELLEVTFRHL